MNRFKRLHTILIVVFSYLLFSSVWILLSDQLVLEIFGPDILSSTRAQTVKGLAFVLLSSGLIFHVLHVELRRREEEDERHREVSALFIRQLQANRTELERAYETIIRGWAMALELRDLETAGHSLRVSGMMELMGEKFGFSEHELRMARHGAILHDVGKMGIPDSILLKPGPLTPEERLLIEQHTRYAEMMLGRTPYLKEALTIPRFHHERWDGSGYPLGLKSEQIPLPARIFAVIDVADSLSSDRCYHDAQSVDEVYHYLQENAGTLFDPAVVQVYVENDLLRSLPGYPD